MQINIISIIEATSNSIKAKRKFPLSCSSSLSCFNYTPPAASPDFAILISLKSARKAKQTFARFARFAINKKKAGLECLEDMQLRCFRNCFVSIKHIEETSWSLWRGKIENY